MSLLFSTLLIHFLSGKIQLIVKSRTILSFSLRMRCRLNSIVIFNLFQGYHVDSVPCTLTVDTVVESEARAAVLETCYNYCSDRNV